MALCRRRKSGDGQSADERAKPRKPSQHIASRTVLLRYHSSNLCYGGAVVKVSGKLAIQRLMTTTVLSGRRRPRWLSGVRPPRAVLHRRRSAAIRSVLSEREGRPLSFRRIRAATALLRTTLTAARLTIFCVECF